MATGVRSALQRLAVLAEAAARSAGGPTASASRPRGAIGGAGPRPVAAHSARHFSAAADGAAAPPEASSPRVRSLAQARAPPPAAAAIAARARRRARARLGSDPRSPGAAIAPRAAPPAAPRGRSTRAAAGPRALL